MQIKLTLDINWDNNTLSVSGDSQGIYDLTDILYNSALLRDAVKSKKSQTDGVEEALLKLNNPELHRIIYAEKYYTKEYKQQKEEFGKFMKDNGLL